MCWGRGKKIVTVQVRHPDLCAFLQKQDQREGSEIGILRPCKQVLRMTSGYMNGYKRQIRFKVTTGKVVG